jgi:hypothetical protein
MPARWYVTTLDSEAAQEVAFLFREGEHVEQEIKRLLRLLANEEDPRHPKNKTELDVQEVEYDAPGWYRIAIHRYAIRIIFRLIVVRRGRRIDLGKEEIRENDQGAIDITRAKHRTDHPYGRELRKRYKRLRGT